MNKAFAIILSLAAAVGARAQNISAGASLPENLGLGLSQLVELQQQDAGQVGDRMRSSPSITSDESGRVIVNIYLDGRLPLAEISGKLTQLGITIVAVDASWRAGAISAALPLSQAQAVAQLAGIQSVVLAHRPIRHVGAVTAQSSIVERAGEVNTPGVMSASGFLGRGISVGIVSDSFDTAAGVPRAVAGVASGDLPGDGNPDGYSEPVVVLADDTSSTPSDEGRAMAEIVHDIAPAAKIAFSAARQTQVAMAASIRNLRTNPRALCDIIVDDISFPDEPFFSDGMIAQALEDVVTSSSLPGKKVSYFSASGNNIGGYAADANIISVANGQAHRGNLSLSQVPAGLYAGGFHNFGSNSDPVIGITVKTGADKSHTIAFQWDDPFNTGNVTTDYNLLVFDATGRYLPAVSGTDNNQATGHPVEIVDLAANTTYQFVIALRTASATARHLRLINTDGSDLTGSYLSPDTITLYGHAAAVHANSVAAYTYNNNPNIVGSYNPDKTNPPPGPYEPAVEGFNARGGDILFYFNAQGQRLGTPEFRRKPDFAAADGVDTSFFPKGTDADFDKDGYPNFFGTSAAAPNAAAFAALLLEAAGGPTSLSAAQVTDILQQSASAHDVDPNFSVASAKNGNASVTLTASGDDSNQSATSPTFFTATFAGQTSDSLASLVIDLTNTNLVFDPRTELGYPFTVGQNTSNTPVSASLSSDLRILTLTFGSGLIAGDSISFGIDRDLVGINAGGNSADLLGGALITGMTHEGQTLYGAFANRLGSDFSPIEGYGLLDARRAVEAIVGKSGSGDGVPLNLSTRGRVGTADEVLIGGIIVNGNAPKKLILRAMGPSLPVEGALGDPSLELYDSNGQKLASDDNWEDDPNQAAQIRATGIAPGDRRESALVETLAPSAYTAVVRGAQASSGIALVEAYDLDPQPASSHLANIATRGSVQAGDNALIGGFILSAPSRVVVRAIGPSLATSGVAGSLSDPTLELRDSQGSVVMANDNWQQNAFQAMQLQTLGIAPSDPLESAMILSLSGGPYTPIVRGSHGATGIGLVEVYDLQ
ncbi:MAG: S8 family serine peptidase [Chthoniobacterales bacterium]